MSRYATIALCACETLIGHETAHLDDDDKIQVFEQLITSWQSTIREIRAGLETCERHVPEGINSEHAVQGMSSPGSIHPLDDENGVRHAGNCARWHTPANSVKRTACNCGATLNR